MPPRWWGEVVGRAEINPIQDYDNENIATRRMSSNTAGTRQTSVVITPLVAQSLGLFKNNFTPSEYVQQPR